MFVNPDVDHAAWDLACDIAVENVITELEIPAVEAARAQGQKKVLDGLRQKMKMITAEKIYRHYRNEGISQDEIAALREHFRADDHAMWYMAGKGAEEGGGVRPGSDPQGLSESWRNIAERIQQDLETFSKTQGDRAGDLVQNLKAVNRERHDYGSFLRKFAVRGEVMRISPDEFDYIYYTYGLRHYKKMPLIEPLEYREAKRIREFVIAIDTSGSVAGELVQAFVQKTYNILKNTESFFSRINLHIIQCDAEIQEDVKITSQEEFDAYLRNMKLHGFGGTDFRPVFRLVDNMVRNHEFTNLKGLVYFTDGYGTFPERKPGYDAAFIFLDDGYEDPETPPWAIKLVLQMDEAEEIFGLSD